MNNCVAVLCAILAAAYADRDRIVGGYAAYSGQLPFMVSLEYVGSHQCGGSIVNPRTIATAAHCFGPSADTTKYKIRAGSLNVASGGQVYQVSRIVIHGLYNKTTQDYDVAVVNVAQYEYIQFSSTVRSVFLASPEWNPCPIGASCVIAGWGRLSTGGSYPTALMAANVAVTNCSAYVAVGRTITTRMMCAAAPGRDACQGDSGGPLVTYISGQAVQCGITSWGAACASPTYPGVYTVVSQVRGFIDFYTIVV